jgi:uncharacterized protein YacL
VEEEVMAGTVAMVAMLVFPELPPMELEVQQEEREDRNLLEETLGVVQLMLVSRILQAVLSKAAVGLASEVVVVAVIMVVVALHLRRALVELEDHPTLTT